MSNRVLKTLISQSYNAPNGHELRQACLEYGHVHNNYKTALDLFGIAELFSQIKSLSTSISIIQKEIHETPIKIEVNNTSNISNISNTFITQVQENPQQTPFIAMLSSHYPQILVGLAGVYIAYKVFKNPKKAQKMLNKILKPIKNLGKILFKALSTSYKWLVDKIFKNIVAYTPTLLENGKDLLVGAGGILIKGLEIGGKFLFEALKYMGEKGYTLLSKTLSMLLGISEDAIDLYKWFRDRSKYGEKTANYLLKLRAEDKEQEKYLMNIKQNLHLSRTARLNLIRVAYQADSRLGHYAKNSL